MIGLPVWGFQLISEIGQKLTSRIPAQSSAERTSLGLADLPSQRTALLLRPSAVGIPALPEIACQTAVAGARLIDDRASKCFVDLHCD